MILRNNYWNSKKSTKMQGIKQQIEDKFKKILIFKPEIHENILKTDTKPADKVVINPNGYSKFISKNKKIRSDKLKEEEKIKNTPGSGKIWKCEITVPDAFVFSEMKLIHRRNKSADLKKSKNLNDVYYKYNNILKLNNEYEGNKVVLTTQNAKAGREHKKNLEVKIKMITNFYYIIFKFLLFIRI